MGYLKRLIEQEKTSSYLDLAKAAELPHWYAVNCGVSTVGSNGTCAYNLNAIHGPLEGYIG